MKHERQEVWAERVRRLEESGLTTKAFAAQNGLNVHTLSQWRWRMRARERQAKAGVEKARFVEVVAQPGTAAVGTGLGGAEMFEVALSNGRQVRVPMHFEVQALRALLTALEGR